MRAAVQYQLAVFRRSQRYVPPALAYLAVLAVFTSDPGGGALPGFAVSAGALLLVAGWMVIALVDAEDPVQRAVTVSHLGSLRRLVTGQVLAAAACAAVAAVVAVVWSIAVHGAASWQEPVIGLLAHLACAGVGVAVALPCSALVVQREGLRPVLAASLLIAVLLVERLPLVHPLLRALTAGTASWPALGLALLAAAVLLGAGTPLVAAAAARRDQ